MMKEHQGYLWRQVESSLHRPVWKKYYYVLTPQALHEYDSQETASRKANAATKKNRLLLQDTSTMMAENLIDGRFVFVVSVLQGRIEWTLAADCESEREEWIEALKMVTTQETAAVKTSSKSK